MMKNKNFVKNNLDYSILLKLYSLYKIKKKWLLKLFLFVKSFVI